MNDVLYSTAKLDTLAVLGLLGTVDSMAYKVHEIENHLHSNEKILGLAGTPSGETHRADRITLLPEPFQANAGNNTWGSWLQLMGSADGPYESGMAMYDFHKILVVDHQRNTTPYFMQIISGESAGIAAKLTAETFTEVPLVTGAGNTETGPINFKAHRVTYGVKCWVRIWAKDENLGTLDFYTIVHENPG